MKLGRNLLQILLRLGIVTAFIYVVHLKNVHNQREVIIGKDVAGGFYKNNLFDLPTCAPPFGVGTRESATAGLTLASK